MFTVKKFSSGDVALTEMAFAIRTKVFVEEQGVDAALEYDHEDEANHYLLMLADNAIATARWRETDKGIKLERFAVLPGFRNRGIGEIILREVLKDVIPVKKMIYLHAQVKAISFYERNGFTKFGEQFTEAGIEHFVMHYHD
jgi:predicted GNAT family N-acyltransferase